MKKQLLLIAVASNDLQKKVWKSYPLPMVQTVQVYSYTELPEITLQCCNICVSKLRICQLMVFSLVSKQGSGHSNASRYSWKISFSIRYKFSTYQHLIHILRKGGYDLLAGCNRWLHNPVCLCSSRGWYSFSLLCVCVF